MSDTVPLNDRPHVTIREDTKGKILLTGLKQLPINSADDMMNALHFGSSIRQTDATAINSKSSRSHAVFSLNLVSKKSQSVNGSIDARSPTPIEPADGDSCITIDSKLHFVDLAGSERLKNSGLTGERVKEGISINAGLASLGKVISQLSSRATGSHVSYRDSRLTRMLQDSLGGNAITYMVACVNPVEFHLSETLNTVQYAQRARAIQSRPQIQQRSDEGDKQLIIDRLRSEIKFLREQIRSSQHGDRRKTTSSDRSLRNVDRENELQNQLLDFQENYHTLSQRHAKLISELSKGNPEDAAKLPNLKGALEHSTRDRINRSNTFAEQVEEVILEYERTIQSLESSLSKSRSSLSTSESNLLEREAKIVYLEAMTQQLQTRIGRVMDREANGENHLRDLEAKLDSVTTGEEKHSVIIQDLRSELIRARESESSAEEYISTIEERLAEAEQDTEVMQREIARLNHVIERQRSIGKLDNLLSELDTLRHDEVAKTNGDSRDSHDVPTPDFFHDRLVATASAHHPHAELEPEHAEEEWRTFGPMDGDDEAQSQYTSASYQPVRAGREESPRPLNIHNRDDKVHSPAQAKAIADKLETMTMELFELRGDHDITVAELDEVSRKYEVALSTLAELQDAVSPSSKNQSTMSFLERSGMQDLREDGQRSSSRILSSGLSSHGESPTLVADSETASTTYSSPHVSRLIQKDETLAESVRALRRSNAEKDISINQLTENYSQLEDQHTDTLRYINELKEEMQKVQAPTPALTPPPILNRRRSNIGKDREGRVYAALQNLALEHLHSNPDAMKDFESNLSAAMTESQLRQERVESLEADMLAAKQELAKKTQMISGLHRERASRSAVTSDVALVNTIKEHLVQTQQYMAGLQESNREHQERLAAGVKSFSSRIADKPDTEETTPPSSTSKEQDDGSLAEQNSFQGEGDAGFGIGARSAGIEKRESPIDLQSQLTTWHTSHRSTFEAVQALEQQLLHAISGLEVSIKNAETMNSEASAAKELRSDARSSPIPSGWESEKSQLLKQVQSLEEELVSNNAKMREQTDKVQHMEKGLEQIKKDARQEVKARGRNDNDSRVLRERIASLEDELDQQKSLAMFHQQGLKAAQDEHARKVDELRSSLRNDQVSSDNRLSQHSNENERATSGLQQELTRAHMENASILQSVSMALQQETEPADLHARLKAFSDNHKSLSAKHSEATESLAQAQEEARRAKTLSESLQEKVDEMAAANEQLLSKLDTTVDKEQKNSKLVQDLEDQLNANFEQHKSADLKLSSAQKERIGVEKELADYRGRVSTLEVSNTRLANSQSWLTSSQAQLLEMKRMTSASHQSAQDSGEESDRRLSQASALRKSNSQASMAASPPPAMPLPPLPAIPNDQGPRSPRPTTPKTTSPPGSRHTSKDISFFQQQQHDSQISSLSTRLEGLEKKLAAEKTLTQTLEEALMDLETTHNLAKKETEAWKERARTAEMDRTKATSERKEMRNSMQKLQEEQVRRRTAEEATKRLEEQMAMLDTANKKKKRGTLNCF